MQIKLFKLHKFRQHRLSTQHIKTLITYKADTATDDYLIDNFNATIHNNNDYSTAFIDSSNGKPIYNSIPTNNCIISTLAVGYSGKFKITQTSHNHTLHFGNTTNFPTTKHTATAATLLNDYTEQCLHVIASNPL